MEQLRVLLVEDEINDARLIERELQKRWPSVEMLRTDTEEAFRTALQEKDWDIVISDFALPQFSGVDALYVLREIAAQLPFLLVSGKIGEERAVEATRKGMNDFLNKNNLSQLNLVVSREVSEYRVRKERQAASEALWAAEHGLRELSGYQPDLLFRYRLKPQRCFQYVGPACQDLLGFSVEEHYNDAKLWLRRCHPDDKDILEKLYAAQGNLFRRRLAIRLRGPDGEYFQAEMFNKPVLGYDGSIETIEGILRDVTSHRRLEEQLYASQRMEAIGQLAGGIAHDFNNLLTVIMNYVEITLCSGTIDPETRENLTSIQDSTSRASKLTKQLLAYAGRQRATATEVCLIEAVKSVDKLIRRIVGENIEVVISHPAEIKPVVADEALLEQVLINLVVNARDAMPNGGKLRFDVSQISNTTDRDLLPASLPPGEYVVLAITDTGVGMTRDVKARVFEPFFTTKEGDRGTGLGLATAYAIVRQLRGLISVTSEPGKGTSFHIYFPVVERSVTNGNAPEEAPSEFRCSETILLVEDEESVRRSLCRILSGHGYRVVTADNGKDALQIVGQNQGDIDLVISDVLMPSMTGPELAVRLQELHPEIKVLFMSGYTGDELSKHNLNESTLQLLRKPFGRAELLSMIRSALVPTQLVT